MLNMLKKVIGRFMQFIFSFLPVKKNTILFCSRGGVYSDNAKYISLCLHKKYPAAKIIFVKSNHQKEKSPSYVKTIPAGSIKYFIYTSLAQVGLDSGSVGMRGYFGIKKGKIHRFIYRQVERRRKGQYSIALWHGTPLKRIGCDSINSRPNLSLYVSADYLIAGCKYTKECFSSAFPCDIPIKLYGTPRNDIFFDKNIDVDTVKKKLHLPKNRKIMLFAPTYRNDIMNSGVSQMNDINFDQLFEILQKVFGGDWCFVFRVHNLVLLNIDTVSIVKKYGDRIIDGNIGDDMAEYLICTDVLITDYSGSMFDFALTQRPCFLYAPDREHYEKVERGFYMDYDELPFSKAYTATELIQRIEEYDEKSYVIKVKKFLEDIGNVEDGHAAERIVDDIILFLNTGEKR